MKKIVILLVGAFVLTACEKNFLDRRLDTNYTVDQVFNSAGTMRDFGLGIYAYLPAGFGRIDGALLASASDEAVHAWPGSGVHRLVNGSWSAFNNPDDQWAANYAGIRKATLFLERSADYRQIVYRDTITESGKNAYINDVNDIGWLRAEAVVLRAFFYFELIKRYGGVPIVQEVLDAEEAPMLPRNSYEQCVEFIVTQIDGAIPALRDSWRGFQSDRFLGRITQGAAMALKARVLLYAASPLNNPTDDASKWLAAAQAAHDVIALDRYALAGNYRDLFRAVDNGEFILVRRYDASNDLERSSYPVGFEGARGGTNPSQNLVDAYETTNGLSIDEDPAYDPQQPYANRDPRLQMSIIVNNSSYKGRTVELWSGGLDGPGKPRASETGYYLKKFVDEGLDLLQDRTSTHNWIYFRYAEILLNYAEAMNEAHGPDALPAGFTLSAREALDRVRQRPGVDMQPVTDADQAAFRERLRNERRVELAFEEHRFWDVRRWQIAEQALGQPIRGVAIARAGDGTITYTYPEQAVQSRVFGSKMYRYPIPRVEVEKTNGALTQNEGW
ncbi:RagB/SusD family nutrient uptake outer membrane protein [Parapedobacter deserti]|uniref:RagB/SusD family nutrient uptake outer membrane protein n=1 Tax=Parapedobacter deserti TaxID=1912957 RepID=A0ABV7JNB3_9SPHI